MLHCLLLALVVSGLHLFLMPDRLCNQASELIVRSFRTLEEFLDPKGKFVYCSRQCLACSLLSLRRAHRCFQRPVLVGETHLVELLSVFVRRECLLLFLLMLSCLEDLGRLVVSTFDVRSRDVFVELLLSLAGFAAVLACKLGVLVDRMCCKYVCAESGLVTSSLTAGCIRISAHVIHVAVECGPSCERHFKVQTLQMWFAVLDRAARTASVFHVVFTTSLAQDSLSRGNSRLFCRLITVFHRRLLSLRCRLVNGLFTAGVFSLCVVVRFGHLWRCACSRKLCESVE